MNKPIDLLISDESLLLQEASDLIVKRAKKEGVEEIDIVSVDNKFDWSNLLANSASMSLFSSVKLTDIRIETKPNKTIQSALVELLSNASEEERYLVRLPKLDKKSKSTKWFKTISTNACVQELWPPQPQAFQGWIIERAKRNKLNLSANASAFLAEKTEGNLLAASQAIEKLNLLHTDSNLDPVELYIDVSEKDMMEVITDSEKFNVFFCLDEALAGNGARAIKMLKRFKQEGQAPISILFNLTKEIQYCNKISIAVSKGQPAMEGLQGAFLWESKKRVLINASARLPLGMWQKLVINCSHMDKLIKGQANGNIWLELESSLWILSGKNIWKAANQRKKVS